MPQHIWHTKGSNRRFCEACDVPQTPKGTRGPPTAGAVPQKRLECHPGWLKPHAT
jgi:hypothetical protein